MPNKVAWNVSQIISSLCNVAVTCKKKEIFIWFLLNQATCSRAMTCVGLNVYGIESQIPFSQTPDDWKCLFGLSLFLTTVLECSVIFNSHTLYIVELEDYNMFM